jgi:glutathione-regulated potassium-efflux system ancillary protein KefG
MGSQLRSIPELFRLARVPAGFIRSGDVNGRRLADVTTRGVDPGDLIDAQGVAELLGLAQRNSVSGYQRRYPDMPRPVVDLGQGRCKLWLRSEIEAWRSERLAGSGR